MAIRAKIEECVPKRDPHERPDYTEAEVQALRASWRGEGDARQQRMALDLIVRMAGTHDMSYRPGDPHATTFAEGRRKVGLDIVWLIMQAPTKTDPDKIATRKTIGDDPNARSDNR
jgi:hypothetical protein